MLLRSLDIKVSQPLPSAKMARPSKFTIAAFLLHLVLHGVDCSLLQLAPWSPLCLAFCLRIFGADMHWLRSTDHSMRPLAALATLY